MKGIVTLMVALLMIGCGKSTEQKHKEKEVTPIVPVDPKAVVIHKTKEWYTDLIENYIANSKKELIVSDRQAKKIDWFLDNTEVNDTANYYIFNIGHTETDNGQNPRFTSDGWIYIDSLTQSVYEYDLPKEQLILWKNN